MRLLTWLVRAFLFFTLFAFALNNLHDVTVHWFFGHQWRGPMVIVALVAFGFGAAFGIVAMVPAWWRHRRARAREQAPVGAPPASSDTPALPEAPPPVIRDGL
jgi:uncharacterized integral membrane protein